MAHPLRKEQTGAADAYKRHQCRLFIYIYIYRIYIIRGSPEHSVSRVRINRPDALAWASDLPPRARVKHHVDDKA